MKGLADLEEKKILSEAYSYFAFDLALWAEKVLGVENMDDQQRELCDAISLVWRAKFYKWQGIPLDTEEEAALKKIGVSAKGGQGTGKTSVIGAWVPIWALDCYGDAGIQIFVTAPNQDQITRDIIWPKVRLWLDRTEPKTGKYLCQCRHKIHVLNETIFTKGKDGKMKSFMVPKVAPQQSDETTAQKTLYGLHNPLMIIIATEATGVREAVFQPLETTMTDPVNMALIDFNPDRNTGFAAATFKSDIEREKWIGVTLNAEKSSIVDANSLEQKRKKGTHSNFYRIYALGEFPLQEVGKIISWDKLIEATTKNFEVAETHPLIAGIDPNGGGNDRTIIAIRQGPKIVALEEVIPKNGETLADACCKVLNDYEIDIVVIWANSNYDCFLGLKKQYRQGVVRGIYEMSIPRDDKKYKNKRAECWGDMADAFDNGLIQTIYKEDFFAELNAPSWINEKFPKQVEDKKRIKRELKRSPDEADAVLATFAFGFEYEKLVGKSNREESDYPTEPPEPKRSWLGV